MTDIINRFTYFQPTIIELHKSILIYEGIKMEIKLKNKFRLLKSILYFLNFMTNSYEKYMWSIIQVELKLSESHSCQCVFNDTSSFL